MQYSYRQNQGQVEGPLAGRRHALARPTQSRNPAWSHLAAHALPIQAKLTVGAPDDEYEQEADTVADRVMRMPTADIAIEEETQVPAVQRLCGGCEDELQRQAEEEEEEEILQAKSRDGTDTRAGGDAQTAVSNLRGGEPLSDGMRAYFEPRMEYDFTDVRVHTGAQANETSHSINAKAFTHGHDIAFADGHFQPESQSGRHLLAHELTHVVQQRRGIHRVVQRDMDTRIHQVYPNASRYGHRIFFDYNRSRIPSSEIAKLNRLGTGYAGKEVKLFGRASEEGDAAHNNLLIGRRIGVVRGARCVGAARGHCIRHGVETVRCRGAARLQIPALGRSRGTLTGDGR